MSNKTQLQTNNTTLDGYIARINAAKETAAGLPEAGGSSSGGGYTVTNGVFTVTDNGIFEPGTNEYYLTSEDLHLDSRVCVLVFKDYTNGNNFCMAWYRDNIEESFNLYANNNLGVAASALNGLKINDSTVSVYGTINKYDEILFKAW